jgi:hypothetical protein
MSSKTIVCLANSRKPFGRCIAGKVVSGVDVGEWIRPVSARELGEVSEHERQYSDGRDPNVLDVIEVPLIKAVPKHYQRENWLLNDKKYWVKQGAIKARSLAPFLDRPQALWVNGYRTNPGLNDRIPIAIASELVSSLCLIEVPDLELRVFAPGKAFGNNKRRVQAVFNYNTVTYKLWITDPKVERPYLAKADGEYELGPCYLCVSLGEPYEDFVYKLVATVIPR